MLPFPIPRTEVGGPAAVEQGAFLQTIQDEWPCVSARVEDPRLARSKPEPERGAIAAAKAIVGVASSWTPQGRQVGSINESKSNHVMLGEEDRSAGTERYTGMAGAVADRPEAPIEQTGTADIGRPAADQGTFFQMIKSE